MPQRFQEMRNITQGWVSSWLCD